MLNYNGKPLEECNYEEATELEKTLLKKILAADRTGMSDNVINQLNFFLDYVKLRKSECLIEMRMGIDGKQEQQAQVLNIGEIESNESDDTE
jgi:hypothetical protein